MQATGSLQGDRAPAAQSPAGPALPRLRRVRGEALPFCTSRPSAPRCPEPGTGPGTHRPAAAATTKTDGSAWSRALPQPPASECSALRAPGACLRLRGNRGSTRKAAGESRGVAARRAASPLPSGRSSRARREASRRASTAVRTAAAPRRMTSPRRSRAGRGVPLRMSPAGCGTSRGRDEGGGRDEKGREVGGRGAGWERRPATPRKVQEVCRLGSANLKLLWLNLFAPGVHCPLKTNVYSK